MDFTYESHCVVVGLGNPGKKYEFTRHNIGYLVAHQIALKLDLPFKEERLFRSLVAKGKWQEKTLHLILPQTYMNESGVAVRKYLDFYKLGAKELVVISDDVELPFEQLRIRSKGGAGGHNGLRSIETHLGTREYLRLRMGVGKNIADATLADYVLDVFNAVEMTKLNFFVLQGMDAIMGLLSEPVADVMNRINRSKA